jgi:hypothetical protein
MARTKISEFSATPANNTDIDSINIAEGCAPSGINDAIRELMAQLKDFQTGAVGDSFNGPIGTTTAAAGAFTTLAASGAVTLSGGTANGVTYLNGSKVLTSGSALTFDGSTTFLQDASGASAQANFRVQTNTAGAVANGYFNINGTDYFRIYGTSSETGLRNPQNTPLFFSTNNTERMRISAAGDVGIGTSSPATKLHIVSTTLPQLRVEFNSSYYTTLSNNGTLNVVDSGTSNKWVFQRNGTEQAIIDPSGNLGLGVTPSAWGSAIRAVQINNTGMSLFTYNSSGTVDQYAFLSNNSFQNSSYVDTYVRTNPAAQYRQLNATHAWYTAPSGTAGTAVSFTQAMTLDASGNLGIGTSSPNGKLDVLAANVALGSNGIVKVGADSSGADVGGQITFSNTNARRAAIAGRQESTDALAGYLQFGTRGTSGDITERARINSSGFFKASNTGSYIGATGPYYEFTSNDISTNQSFIFYNNNTSINQAAMMFLGANRNTTNNTYYYFGCFNYQTSTYKLLIADSGNVTNTNNSYGAISDVKLKENIVDASPKLADLMQVKVRNYNLIGDTTKQIGVVAQELETVFPAMVDESPDRDAEGNDLGTTTKSVKYSVFVPMLIKAIHEQQALIQSLKARLDAANL